MYLQLYNYLYGMLCIQSKSNDPYFNLAAEEYLLKNSREDIFMLWQSKPVVVVGKHQNTLAEINYRYIRSVAISVARRLTGGGAVYHDAGNINFTFIRQGEPGKLVDFAGFIAPVIGFLKSIGVDAVRGPKNEILVNERKISGNAEHVYKNRVLHHGTLLYNSDLDTLRKSINRGDGIYNDKAVKSNRSSVINLANCISPVMSIEAFQAALLEYIVGNHQGTLFNPGDDPDPEIRRLATEKYRTWEWIYGWSPDYEYHNQWRSSRYDMEIKLATHRGLITSCTLRSSLIQPKLTEMVSEKLTGISHDEIKIQKILETSDLISILDKRELEDLVLAFF